jgi:hypothetical protein
MKLTFLSLAAALALSACSNDGPHNLSVDEARRAQTYAEAFFNGDHPGGVDTAGALVKKKGSFQACRPQDSNSNGLVTCTGMLPNLVGGFVQATRYCGYESGSKAILGCSDKDQK